MLSCTTSCFEAFTHLSIIPSMQMQHTNNNKGQAEYHPAPDGVVIGNEIGEQADDCSIEQCHQAADGPKSDAGILQEEQQQENGDADYEAECRMNE